MTMDDERENGNVYATFADLMKLQRVDDHTFKSLTKAFSPGNETTAYGGHVFAQAVWAAAQTVKEGFVVHNVTGWFTIAGNTAQPFAYTVRNVRDGKLFCTRAVDASQARGVCFTCTCSFKRSESSPISHQEPINLAEQYALGQKKPEDWPEAPGVDSPWFWEAIVANGDNYPFPGLSIRKVDMTSYNKDRSPTQRRQLQYYSVLGSLPPLSSAPNLHACAHLYASDRNSDFVITNHMDVGNDFTHMASLSHSVVFHAEPEALSMVDEQGKPRWFCQEARMTRAGGNRGMHESRLVDEGGVHVATTWQDALVRFGGRMGTVEELAERLRAKL
ncbi:hypothetical protein H2201_007419 [Coniosporium apollinis]|uniref:Acyl-CoA thioesterase II n=1 Tax=Coniosporium apollinis TaxID=61459 RepID=A0ABQ9NN93_9PEZI|nr:hypothetical protein H2201_007419 [Coniosporium apollinis]